MSGNDTASKQATNEPMANMPMLNLKFIDDSIISVGIRDHQIGNDIVKSISAIAPMGNAVLIAEMGIVGMIPLLEYARNPKAGLATPARLVIVGIGDEVPDKYELGMVIVAKNKDTYGFRDVHDPTNDYSFDALIHTAKKDKHLLAAMAIVNNKDKTKLGLNMDFASPSIEVLEEMNKVKSNNNMGNLVFKGKELKFVNYKLMDWTNIDAILDVE